MTARFWLEQCESARGIEAEFGVQQALSYLVGEKFLDFLEATDQDATLRADLPAFVAEIKSIFEAWQLAEYLETASETEPFDPTIYDDEETAFVEVLRTCCWSSEAKSGCWASDPVGCERPPRKSRRTT
jgi:hypothetical protein